MELIEFLIGFFIALFVGIIMFYGFKRRGPWNAFWIFLLFLILAAWAGRLWLAPVGPEFWGFGWLSVVFWVFIFGLLIAIATPTDPSAVDRYDPETGTRIPADTTGAGTAFGFLFWMLLLFLLIAIIGGLWY